MKKINKNKVQVFLNLRLKGQIWRSGKIDSWHLKCLHLCFLFFLKKHFLKKCMHICRCTLYHSNHNISWFLKQLLMLWDIETFVFQDTFLNVLNKNRRLQTMTIPFLKQNNTGVLDDCRRWQIDQRSSFNHLLSWYPTMYLWEGARLVLFK